MPFEARRLRRLPERLEILLAIVIGRRKAGRLQRGGVAGDRAPFVGRLGAVVLDSSFWGPLLGARRSGEPRSGAPVLGALTCGLSAGRLAVCRLSLALARASSSAACEIWASRSSIEAAISRSPPSPVRSKSSASSSSFATSLSRFLVVVGFCAMSPLPCTSGAGGRKTGYLLPAHEAHYAPPVSKCVSY